MKAIVCKLKPNKSQLEIIKKTVGCCRFVYNHYIGEYKDKKWSHTEASRNLTQLKLLPDKQWLNEVPCDALHQSLRDLDKAWHNKYLGASGKPVYHKRTGEQSYRNNGQGVKIVGKHSVKLPILKNVRCEGLKQLKKFKEYRILSATIHVTPDDYCIIVFNLGSPIAPKNKTDDDEPVYVNPKFLPPSDKKVGIDLGIHTTMTLFAGNFIKVKCSDGIERDFGICEKSINKPKNYLNKLYDKREFYQSKRSESMNPIYNKRTGKMEGGSKRNAKWMKKQWKISRKIQNVERGFCKKVAYELCRDYGIMHFEDLSEVGMIKDDDEEFNKNLQRSIMSMLKTVVENTSKKYGRKFEPVSQYAPTTQKCHVCGYVNTDLKGDISTREWICPECGIRLNRDENASVNIFREPPVEHKKLTLKERKNRKNRKSKKCENTQNERESVNAAYTANFREPPDVNLEDSPKLKSNFG